MKIKVEDYEKNFDRFNEIIEKLESGNISLDESLKLYTEANEIYKALLAILDEQKLKIIEINESDLSGEG